MRDPRFLEDEESIKDKQSTKDKESFIATINERKNKGKLGDLVVNNRSSFDTAKSEETIKKTRSIK